MVHVVGGEGVDETCVEAFLYTGTSLRRDSCVVADGMDPDLRIGTGFEYDDDAVSCDILHSSDLD